MCYDKILVNVAAYVISDYVCVCVCSRACGVNRNRKLLICAYVGV